MTIIKIVTSYSHEDNRELGSLKKVHTWVIDALKIEFSSEKVEIEEWHDENLDAGTTWDPEIRKQLASADIVVALIGPSYVSSVYAFGGTQDQKSEFDLALELRQQDRAELFPILLELCDAQHNAKLNKVQIIPGAEEPASDAKTWASVKNKFRQTLRKVIDKKSAAADIPSDYSLNRYLDWVIDRCGWVDGSLATPVANLPNEHWKMEERYIPLRVQVEYGAQMGSREDVLAALQGNPRFVLLGQPGEGKTTAFRYAAHSYAIAAKKDPRRIPIPLKAMTVASYLQSRKLSEPGVTEIVNIWDGLNEQFDWGLPKGWLKTVLDDGRAVVIIDALDEIDGSRASQILTFIRNCSVRWGEAQWCVGTRAHTWSPTDLPGFRIGRMCELDDSTVQDWVRSWSELVPDPAGFTQNLIRAMQDTPALLHLARRPLYLTAICIVYQATKQLPTGQGKLFELITKWLIESRNPHRPKLSFANRFTMYSLVAHAMCDLPEDSRGDIDELARRIVDASLLPNLDRQRAIRLIEAEEAIGLLRRDQRRWGFSHRSFQDYFAACFLAGASDEIWTSVVKERAHRNEWVDVFAFFAEMLVSAGRTAAAARLIRLLLAVLSKDTLRDKAAAISLVTRVFQHVPLSSYDLSLVQEYHELASEVMPIFEPDGNQVSVKERYDAAVALGVGGDLRLREVAPGMVAVPAGKVWVGAQSSAPDNPNYDAQASDSLEGPAELVFSGPFEIGCYPVTVHEYERFITAGGYAPSGKIWWDEEGWKIRCEENLSAPRDWTRQLLKPNCPVVGVNAFEAEAYCRWLTDAAKGDWYYRLPSEDEWEFAARRNDSHYRAFSWGDENWNLSNLFGFSQVVPIGLFVQDRSASGLRDLCGNVSCWTRDDVVPTRAPGIRVAAARVVDSAQEGTRIIKGGNYRNGVRSNRVAARVGKQSHLSYPYVGFRVLRRRKPIRIKGKVPSREYPCSLADNFEKYVHLAAQGVQSRQDSLNSIDPGMGDRLSAVLAILFPGSARSRILLPCRLGDNRSKFDFNLLYQDSRIKVACEEQLGISAEESRLVDEIDRRLRAVACILAYPQHDETPLWCDLNDNDLDAIVFAVLDHFEPNRRDELHRHGVEINRAALAALPSHSELKTWELAEVMKHQIFAGVRLLNPNGTNLATQFQEIGRFPHFALKEFEDRLLTSERLLFLFDDNGELVWDLALIELLLDRYPELKIIGVVSTHVVGNNATWMTLSACLEEHRFARLRKELKWRFELHREDNRRSCIDATCASGEFKTYWSQVDCIYLKGVAAFETLQRLPKPSFYAFVVYSDDSVKCSGYTRDTGLFFGVPPNFSCFEYNRPNGELRYRLRTS